MNSTPYIPTPSDWVIIVAGITILGSLLAVSATFLIIRLIRFVGLKLFLGWLAIAAFIFMALLSVLGN